MDVRLHRHVTSSQIKISDGVTYHMNWEMPFEHRPPGLIGADTLRLFMIGLPLLLAGTWVGLRLYTRPDEAGFRRAVLVLLLISPVGLIARGS